MTSAGNRFAVLNIYTYHDGNKGGPFTRAELQKELVRGNLPPSALVWHSGLPEWVPLKNLPAVEKQFKGAEETYMMPPLPAVREKRVKVVRLERIEKPSLGNRILRMLGVAR